MQTNGSYTFNFTILDVAGLLNLEVRHRGGKSIDVDCPLCGKKGKMNLNMEKNVFRCNYCNEFGGMIDRPINNRKYIWFSSSEKDGGTGAGSPTHFIGDPADEVVYITEGPLKATVAHILSGKTFAAVAGVNQYVALEELLERLKANGTKTIVETYDMDKLENPHVENGCLKLIELCVKHGFEVKRLRWDPAYKGIDDLLYARKK